MECEACGTEMARMKGTVTRFSFQIPFTNWSVTVNDDDAEFWLCDWCANEDQRYFDECAAGIYEQGQRDGYRQAVREMEA